MAGPGAGPGAVSRRARKDRIAEDAEAGKTQNNSSVKHDGHEGPRRTRRTALKAVHRVRRGTVVSVVFHAFLELQPHAEARSRGEMPELRGFLRDLRALRGSIFHSITTSRASPR